MMGGMSVSGYILEAPGLGLKNTVSPVEVAALVSAGTDSPGDGKIFIDTIEDAIDIGSKQKGMHAI